MELFLNYLRTILELLCNTHISLHPVVTIFIQYLTLFIVLCNNLPTFKYCKGARGTVVG
jgi:hypothetical protein